MTDVQYGLAVAEQLLSHALLVPDAEAEHHVGLAIASLELCLSSSLPLDEELRARLLLSRALYSYTNESHRAEDLIAKSLVRVHSQKHLVQHKLAFNELLSRILLDSGSMNASRRIIKDSLTICGEGGRPLDAWHYVFLLRSIDLDLSLSAIRSFRVFAEKRENRSAIQLAKIFECYLHVCQGIQVPAAALPILSSDSAIVATTNFSLLEYMHLALSILSDIIAGDIVRPENDESDLLYAKDKLTLIHDGLDNNPDLESTIRIPISQTDDTTSNLLFTGFSTKRFVIFMYVLSAVLHLPEISSFRCEKFLNAAQEQLSAESRNTSSSTDKWCHDMQAIIHTYKAFSHLLHAKAGAALFEIQQIETASPAKPFLAGCAEQMIGNLDAALHHYSITPKDEWHTLAQLNTVLIFSGGLRRDDRKVKDLCMQLESQCSMGPLATSLQLVRCACNDTTSISLKRALNSVLIAAKRHANTQLNMLALSLLGVKSDDADSIRVKFASYALSQASKSTSSTDSITVWSLMNGLVLENIMARKVASKTLPSEIAKAEDNYIKAQTMNSGMKTKLNQHFPTVYKALATT